MLYKILGKHLEDDIKYFQVKKSPLLTFLIVCVGGVKAKLKDSVPPSTEWVTMRDQTPVVAWWPACHLLSHLTGL